METTIKTFRKVFLLVVILIMGGVGTAFSADYFWEGDVKYTVHSEPSRPNFLYVVDLASKSEITIPHYVYYNSSNASVLGFADVTVTSNSVLKKLIIKDGALDNGFGSSDLSKLQALKEIDFEGSVCHLGGAKLPKSLDKIYWGSKYGSNFYFASRHLAYKEAGVPLVTAVPMQTNDDGIAFHYNDDAAYVVGVSGSATSIVIPTHLYTKYGEYVRITSFGAVDVEGMNTQVTDLVFEGTITTYADFSCFPNLENITFNGIYNFNGSCSLEGKLKKNTALKSITFNGTLPSLSGAATDYFASPGSIVAYVEESTNIDELRTRDVWKAFRDIRYIGSDVVTPTYTITVETYHGAARVPGIDGKITDETGPQRLTVEQGSYKNFFAYAKTGDYKIKHVYLNGIDIFSQMQSQILSDGQQYYYQLRDISSNCYFLVMGEADHAVFTQLGVYQSGEGSATLIATRADGTTTETLNLPNTTPNGMLNVPSVDLSQVELRLQCVNDGRPIVYNGETLLTDDQVKWNSSGHYYYVTLTQKELSSGNFTVSYPLRYDQQEGVVKTTIVVGEVGLSDYLTYYSVAPGEEKNGSMTKNSTEEFYHKNTATITLNIRMYASWPLRVRENGVDVTDNVVANTAYSYTYTVQHPNEACTIVIDNGEDMAMRMTSNTAGVVAMQYKDKNGTLKKQSFNAGINTFALSSKTSSEQELIVTTDMPFTLYCGGEDISAQYASSNTNASDVTKTDYHYPASSLQFVDGETTELVFMLNRTMPVSVTSNTKDARGVKIVTYKSGNEEATMRTWGTKAQAPFDQWVDVYFYFAEGEQFKQLTINGIQNFWTLSNPSQYYAQWENHNDEHYRILKFQPAGMFETLDLQMLLQGENAPDVTKDNAIVMMNDESGEAKFTMTYNSGTDTETKSMRRGTKVFDMPKASGTDADFLEMELLMPVGYECKLLIDGTNYTPYVENGAATQIIGDKEFVIRTLRFDSSFYPNMRRQNTSWAVSVRKQATGAYNWNIALMSSPRVSISLYDEDNANKETSREAFAYIDLTESGSLSIDPKTEGFDLTLEADEEQKEDYGWNLSAWEQDYELVVTADGQDLSNLFHTNYEFGYYARGLDHALLSAENWVIGFKRKNAGDSFTWTAVQTGNRGGSNAEIVIDDNISWTFDADNKPATKTVADTELSAGQTVVTVRVDAGYAFRALFNGTDLTSQFVKGDKENNQDVYTLTFTVKNTPMQTSPLHTDGVWMFNFINGNEPVAGNVPTWTIVQTDNVEGAEVTLTRDGLSETTALTELSTQVNISNAESATLKVPGDAGSTYKLYLTRYNSDEKLDVIRVVREITGLGLKEAKDLVEQSFPILIKTFATLAEVQAAETKLKDAGTSVTTSIESPSDVIIQVLRDGVDVTAEGQASDGYLSFTVSAADLTSSIWVILCESVLDSYDVNGDGQVTIADVTKLVNKILGKE